MISFKRILSAVTASVMAVTAVSGAVVGAIDTPTNAVAEPYSYSADNDYSVEGTNAIGNLFAERIEAEMRDSDSAEEENGGCYINSLEINGKTAVIGFETMVMCTAVVAIYDDTGAKMLASGSAAVSEGETTANVAIEIETMPESFMAKAYLVDTVSMRPLCEAFECRDYTAEMQAFFATTTSDFDAERVIDLSGDPTDSDANFAVLKDEVIMVEYQSNKNKLYSSDDENKIYCFEYTDSSMYSLAEGDILAYTCENGDLLIIKVKTKEVLDEISMGMDIKITGDEVNIEEVFTYVRLETGFSSSDEDVTVDVSQAEYGEGVTYVPNTEAQSAQSSVGSDITAETKDLDINDSFSYGIKFEMDYEAKKGVHVIGGIEFKHTFSYTIYHDARWFEKDYVYIEFTKEDEITLSASVSGEIEDITVIKLVDDVTLYSNGALKITMDFGIEIQAEAAITLEATITKLEGFRFDSDVGKIEEIKSGPVLKTDAAIEGTIYIGPVLSIEASIKAGPVKLASATLEVKVGAEIEGHPEVYSYEEGADEIHACENVCISGTIYGVASLSIKVEVFGFFKETFTLAKLKSKISDFYLPYDGFFEFGTCPNKRYRVTLVVTNNEQPLSDVKATLYDEADYTDEKGQIECYLAKGTHSLKLSKDGYKTRTVKTTVYKEPKTVSITLSSKKASTDNIDSSSKAQNVIKQISMGNGHSAVLMNDGSLYMWGDNDDGQIGNGTTTDQRTPIKIMDNVAFVSLGSQCSAAIKTDGSLYTWGDNECGQLGNGTTTGSLKPNKILDNISYVEFGGTLMGKFCGAISRDQKLYLWGNNGYGQIGDGTEIDCYTPKIIMNNVSTISLGAFCTAAIKSDHTLYMWGTHKTNITDTEKTYSCNEPAMIAENVKSVSLSYWNNSMIDINNNLYMWGTNKFEQLLYNDTNVYTPKLIATNIKQVSCGYGHNLAVGTNNILYAWGLNNFGQIGNRTTTNQGTLTTILGNIAMISAGSYHSSAVDTSGNLYMWGRGYLGDGTALSSSTPTKITLPTATASSTSAINASVKTSSPAEETFIPNEIYNIYGMKSRTADEPFSADNLLFITQVTSDSTGKLTYDYQPDEECVNPVIFAKAMTAFEVNNAQITKAASGSGKISLEWTAADGADMYKVYRVVNGIYLEETTTTATAYTVTGLTNGTEYGFMVASRVNGEWSYISENDVVYATPQIQKPTITKAAPSDGKVALNWTAVDGAEKYAVYTYVNGKWTCAGTRTELGMYVDGLTNGTKYGFAVKAYVNGAWTEVTSADIVYATPVGASKPKITSVEVGDGKIGLNWTSVSGAAKYAVYVNSGSGWNCAGTRTALGMYVNGLTNGTKYGFAVKAYVNNAWTEVTSSDIVYATPVSASKPKITSVEVGDGKIGLNWTSVSGATKYAVYVNSGSGWNCAGTRTALGMYVNGLTNGTKYGFAVKAYVNN
ncbi:MAG: hypothetical protein IJ368_08670, partial [Oscillospiraceae bacterium]|nr:hypothetical protein [Oscillospiraceae bacterium]